ncbi:MAG: AMP-dependent synthetase, partial [Ruminococcaceae bacterium]|nr:AMP-dependent synthetase [Oscillospiraceae bacterium]
MKISFSTLGCPDFAWTDIYSCAKDFGFDGIEIRGLGNDIFAVKARPFTDSQIGTTIATLERLGLEIPCLASGCCLKFADKLDAAKDEIKEYVTLAAKLGTPYIRVLADLDAAPAGEIDDVYMADAIREVAEIAKDTGVTLLIETNGVYADTRRLRALLDAVNLPYVAALWDTHHPYRFMNELPAETVANLGDYIKHVHVKDSVMENGAVKYKLMGQGDMPIPDMLRALQSISYEGFISLEWVKRWAKDIADCGIVFPHFARYMRSHMAEVEPPLQTSRRGIGKYIWPKEHLIDYTFPQLLDRICEEFPEQYAFRYTTLDYTRTYPEFRDDVDTFARALVAMGVKRGDHVAIWATNVPAWYITFWATVKIGAVLVTVNTAYKIHEAQYLLSQSDTHTLVMVEGYKDSN